MLLSKIPSTLRAVATISRNKKELAHLAVRNHGDLVWSYRTAPPPPKKSIMLAAEWIQATMWWWMLWHCWTEPGHLFGEFEYPDARKWTDEELGIPNELELDQ